MSVKLLLGLGTGRGQMVTQVIPLQLTPHLLLLREISHYIVVDAWPAKEWLMEGQNIVQVKQAESIKSQDTTHVEIAI